MEELFVRRYLRRKSFFLSRVHDIDVAPLVHGVVGVAHVVAVLILARFTSQPYYAA